MPDLKEKLSLLVSLQEKDCAADIVRRCLEEIPGKIEEQKLVMTQLRSEAEEKKKSVVQLQLRRKQKEMELAEKESQIKKHSMELNSVKTNDAYKALLTEIDTGKKEKENLETEILEMMEGIDKESVQAKEIDKELKQKEAEVQAIIAKLEGEQGNLQAEVARFDGERAEYAKQIPQDVLSRYESVREARSGIAMAPVEGENCGVCHMQVRPQVINDICKGQDIQACDSCMRILYKK